MARYIDADALLNNTDGLEHVKYSQEYGHVVLVCDIIYAPTVDVPERNVGKWIDGWRSGFDGTRHWFRACSECGYEREDDDPEKDTNYCPDCGARMRGEEDE